MISVTEGQTKLGFIGIGAMGSRITGRLIKHGFPLMVFDGNVALANALREYGVTVTRSVAELASSVDVVMSCLTNDDAVRTVYTGPQGVLAHIRRGALIIEMSTVSPETSRDLSTLAAAKGIRFLDVTISGSTAAAEEGMLTLFGGGDEASFQAAGAIFPAISRQAFYMGPSGSGNSMKLVVNTLLGVGMQAIAEAVVLGQKAGLDRRRLLDVLSKTAVVAPAHVGKLVKALTNDYKAQFGIGLMNKDFRLILDAAANLRVPMPTVAAAYPINTAEFSEHANTDFSAVIRRMEELANINSVKEKSEREPVSHAN